LLEYIAIAIEPAAPISALKGKKDERVGKEELVPEEIPLQKIAHYYRKLRLQPVTRKQDAMSLGTPENI
jgi:hypothetical protein